MIDRRELLRRLTGGLGAAIAGLTGSPSEATEADKTPPDGHRWGMAIDLDRCTACGACVVACQQENNLPTPVSQGPGREPIEWMSMLWTESDEPEAPPEMFPFPCQHCEHPPCTKVCPVGATFKDPEGIVAQIWARCIGCRYCTVACPYLRRSFNWEEPSFEGSLVQTLNPDVATRPRNVVEKCTFCNHRVQAVKERAAVEGRRPTDDELRTLTACATACPTQAITFGDKNDPQSTVSRLSGDSRAFRLMEELGTEPAVVYLKRHRRS